MFHTKGGHQHKITRDLYASGNSSILQNHIMIGIYRLCGLTRSRVGSSSKTELRSDIPKWVYRYDKQPGSWVRILPDPELLERRKPGDRPRPRYAHQMVYDPKTDVVFMHGGNGGVMVEGEADRDEEEVREEDENRLDDFWMMKLKRCVFSDFVFCLGNY